MAVKTPETDKLFIDKKNVLLCRPRDSYDLSEKIIYLIENTNERLRLGGASFKFASEQFSWDSVVSKTVNALGLNEVDI